MDPVIRVQILSEADYISRSSNTLGEGMNPTILSPAMDRLGSLALVATSLGEGKPWIKISKTPYKSGLFITSCSWGSGW